LESLKEPDVSDTHLNVPQEGGVCLNQADLKIKFLIAQLRKDESVLPKVLGRK
jgi:hypothetical protein